ncbi:hypothetical protein D3C80_1669440 [compost metagenome]
MLAEVEQGLHRLIDVVASVKTGFEVLLLDAVQGAVGLGVEVRRHRVVGQNPGFANHLPRPHAPGFELVARPAQGHRDHARFDDEQMIADLARGQDHLARAEGDQLHVLAEGVLFILMQGRENGRAFQQRSWPRQVHRGIALGRQQQADARRL